MTQTKVALGLIRQLFRPVRQPSGESNPVSPNKRKLARQLSFIVRGIVLVVFVFVYFYTVPMIKQQVFEIERNASRLALNNVYEIASRMYTGVEQYRQQTLDGHKKNLRMAVDMAERFLDAQTGLEAQSSEANGISQAALEQLKTFTFGNNDYVWVVDYEVNVLSHPDDRFHGQHAPRTFNIREADVLQNLVDQARRDGEGFYRYRWPRLSGPDNLDKVSLVKDFPQWGLVIGAGVYLDDLDQEVEQRKQQALQELRQALEDIKIAKTGYMYLFDRQGYMLIHPNQNLDGVRFISHQNPLSGEPIYKELMAVADTGKELHYRWDRPEDPGNYDYEKLSLVRYIDGFDWYICSSVYLDELQNSSELLSTRIMVLAAITMLATLLVSNFFVDRITRPLERLASTALRVQRGDLSARTGMKGEDEIGILATSFDAMVTRLSDNIDSLDSEVKQRTEELLASHNQAQRMSAVGQLAGGLAHDFNNLLSIILGNLAIARERYGTDEELYALLNPAHRAASRGADITHRLLAFARKQPMTVEPVLLTEVLDEAVELLTSSFAGAAQLVYQPHANLKDKYARLDASLLENALVNLGLNAKDALTAAQKTSGLGQTLSLPLDAQLCIRAFLMDIDQAMSKQYSDHSLFDEAVKPGSYLMIEFEDNGPGFSAEAIERGIEPFFSTKTFSTKTFSSNSSRNHPSHNNPSHNNPSHNNPSHNNPSRNNPSSKPETENSGLGLSMVFGFAKQSGGYLNLANRSSPPRSAEEDLTGALVQLLLPVSEVLPPSSLSTATATATSRLKPSAEPVDSPMAFQTTRPPQSDGLERLRGQLFLLVEDEPDVRALVRRYLTNLGMHTLEAANADEALELYEALTTEGTRVRGLVTDIMMPGGLTGIALANRLTERQPDLLVILMSGYAYDAYQEQGDRQQAGHREAQESVKPGSEDIASEPQWPLLSKPFDQQALAQAIVKRLL